MAGVRITQLEPDALPGRRYGSFSGKPLGFVGHAAVGKLTQLMTYGTPGKRYKSFGGRPLATVPQEIPRLLYIMGCGL